MRRDPFAVDDPRDEIQARAHLLLGKIGDTALTELGAVLVPDTPSSRLGIAYLSQSVEYLVHCHFVLKPGERVFHRALLAGGLLRTMTDLYAGCLDIWSAPDRDVRMAEIAAMSMGQERRAFEAAGRAGAEVHDVIRALDTRTNSLPKPSGVRLAQVLEAAGEDEMLTVYRFESAHIHFGEAARRARVRTLSESRNVSLDVHLDPPSLWRVGQLTWAALGVWRRLASFICLQLDLAANVLRLAVDAEPDVRVASERPKRESEPISPPYHAFAFPRWPEPAPSEK
jgi:hypothetical protein